MSQDSTSPTLSARTPHSTSALTDADIEQVSPKLAALTQSAISDGVWQRPGLSQHDRSVIVVSALIARSQTIGMAHYFNLVLDKGVTPAEMSEIVLHCAFYCGWSNAFNAVAILKDIFAERGIEANQLPQIDPELLPLNQALPDNTFFMDLIDQNIEPLSPALANYSKDLLYHNIWLRPDLSMRDRNLVSLTALIAQGLSAFLEAYMLRGIQQGITKAEMGELFAQVAFYAGWPTVIPCMAAVQKAYEA